MNEADLLEAEKLPEDLKWVVERFRLPPNDPVYLFVLWHWHRVQKAEDGIRLKTLEAQAALDQRVKTLTEAANKIVAVNDRVNALHAVLEQKPVAIARRIETELKTPVAETIANIRGMEQSLAASLSNARDVLSRVGLRQTLAALCAGFTAGAFLASFFWLQ